ncbi:Uncharacterized conserved protein [Ceraceosorus bombacis]|uniref:Uncharacterized conserved protein n=1 Tax=Ceraceosorus bombacis TaxID=401625 RepID=A0A0P1BLS9_9BASI|nr:Uncharacterized conserved protein [Ceraceosorus bombacis]
MTWAESPEDGGNGPFPNDRIFPRYWLQQQLTLSLFIGIGSFLLFSLIRRKYSSVFAPRTKLKGFTPHAQGIDDGVFSWIRPTIATPESSILHIVGLDAAVLLSFFKMGFWIFAFLSIWTCGVLMPVHWHYNGTIDGVPPSEDDRRRDPPNDGGRKLTFARVGDDKMPLPGPGQPAFPWSPPDVSALHLTHLLTLYLTTALVLRALWKGGLKFVRNRQLYALDLLPSIPARTIEMRYLPQHLRDERKLAEYWENCGLQVESTAVGRQVGGLSGMLARRANKLYELEGAWVKWLGNPTRAEGYDPDKIAQALQSRAEQFAAVQSATSANGRNPTSAADIDTERAPLLSSTQQQQTLDMPDALASIKHPAGRARPTKRLGWLGMGRKVDLLDHLACEFFALDSAVRSMREQDRPSANTGYVTFVDAASAQIAAQTVHYPLPFYCKSSLAVEPRDLIWSNVSLAPLERRLRQLLVSAFTFTLFIFYIPPLAFLASLLSPAAIEKYLPWLWRILERSDRLKALVSTSLPSLVLISFNALLPMVLEWTAYLQGLRAKSLVELSVLKRYHLFLVISVIFIFLVTTTLWSVLQDLATSPAKVLDKLAQSLPGARFFSLSYVVLQSLAVMPLQLLQLPLVLSRAWGRLFARTPREHAELNAPPQLYAGSVYPAAIIVFTLGVVYSIVSPLVTVFGAIYFGIGYVVFKYKLLFVFYKAYESKGQAWLLTSTRCVWALLLYQVFQIGLFSFRKQVFLSLLCLPLFVVTAWYGRHLNKTLQPLSEYVSLSSITAVTRQEAAVAAAASQGRSLSSITPRHEDVNPLLALRLGTTPDAEHTALARKRYSAKDETLFVAQRDAHTDYREPPATGYYNGTLDTGRRRYGHPALTGQLPEPWLPIPSEDFANKAQATLDDQAGAEEAAVGGDTSQGSAVERTRKSSTSSDVVVLSLRRRKSSLLRRSGVSSLLRSGSVLSSMSRSNAPQRSSSLGPAKKSVGSQSADESAGVWGGVQQGPRGSSAGAALGEALGGPETTAPSRRKAQKRGTTADSSLLDHSVREEEDEDGPRSRSTPRGAPIRVLDGEAEALEPDQDEDDVEDEEDEAAEGVYYHRRPRDLPGSFPGFLEDE